MSLRSPSGWMNATDVRSSRTAKFSSKQHVFYVQSSVDGVVTISAKLWNLSNLHNDDKKTQCFENP